MNPDLYVRIPEAKTDTNPHCVVGRASELPDDPSDAPPMGNNTFLRVFLAVLVQ